MRPLGDAVELRRPGLRLPTVRVGRVGAAASTQEEPVTHEEPVPAVGSPPAEPATVGDRPVQAAGTAETTPGPTSGPTLGPTSAPTTEPWEPPSWDEVVRTHSARVYRLAYRLTGNPHDAEDLTQDVFVRVFRSLSSYTPGTFEGWLHRITTNLFLDRVRRQARIRFEALPEDAERVPGREGSPAQQYDDTHLEGDVQDALDALPPDFRAAVVLCDIEGLTYEEIAATLGIKIGTVRSRIHRGRSQLRVALADRAPTGRRRGAPEPAPAADSSPALEPSPAAKLAPAAELAGR